MLGLIIAAMFSATMGNLSSHFNVRASVLTNDVYRRLIRPHAGDKELVTAGRGMTIVVGGLTILMAVALAADSAEDLFKYMVNLFGGAVAPLGLPLLIGLVSRRVTPRSVATALIVGVILAVVLFLGLPESAKILGIIFEREVMIFAVSFVTVMTIMFGMSAIWPMTVAESQRADLFHKRLATPIGSLPEDEAGKQHEEAFSPFRVVGICVLLIGVLMFSIQPWLSHGLANWLNLGIAAVLLSIGAMVTVVTGKRKNGSR